MINNIHRINFGGHMRTSSISGSIFTRVAIACGLVGVIGAAHAGYSSRASADSFAIVSADLAPFIGHEEFRQPTVSDLMINPDGGSVAQSATALGKTLFGIDLSGSSAATASASAGALHLWTSSGAQARSVAPAQDVGWGGGTAIATFANASTKDTLIFNIGGHTAGEMVTILYSVRVDGSMGTGEIQQGNGITGTHNELSWDSALGNYGDGGTISKITENSVLTTDLNTFSFGTQLISANVLLGQQTDFSLVGRLYSQGNAGVSCSINAARCPDDNFAGMSAQIDMRHTIAWGGVVSVSDASGQSIGIDRLSISSDSNFQYNTSYIPTAIPEPPVYVLIALGLTVVGCSRRKAASAQKVAICQDPGDSLAVS